ncbi:hypothetical protein AgCh_002451 [Apium graveolens]
MLRREPRRTNRTPDRKSRNMEYARNIAIRKVEKLALVKSKKGICLWLDWNLKKGEVNGFYCKASSDKSLAITLEALTLEHHLKELSCEKGLVRGLPHLEFRRMKYARHARMRSRRQYHIKVKIYLSDGEDQAGSNSKRNDLVKSILDDNGIVTRDKAKLDVSDIMFSRCQSARFQVDPRESNLIAINKIFRYLKGLPTLGVKYPKDIMLNMFGYIDIDYAGFKKDRRSISEAINISDRRSI